MSESLTCDTWTCGGAPVTLNDKEMTNASMEVSPHFKQSALSWRLAPVPSLPLPSPLLPRLKPEPDPHRSTYQHARTVTQTFQKWQTSRVLVSRISLVACACLWLYRTPVSDVTIQSELLSNGRCVK